MLAWDILRKGKWTGVTSKGSSENHCVIGCHPEGYSDKGGFTFLVVSHQTGTDGGQGLLFTTKSALLMWLITCICCLGRGDQSKTA